MSLRGLIGTLAAGKVDFVIVGMVAGNIHGSQYVTEDLNVVYAMTVENVHRLCEVLAPLQPRIAQSWPLEGSEDAFTPDNLLAERSVTVLTTQGEIDLLHRIDGIGDYAEVLAMSEPITVDGRDARVISLGGLIATKRASGREKDRLHLSELELIAELESLEGGND